MDHTYLANESRNYETQLKGFDDYELKLGDIMRGERATLGKSLLDVQRELRIKASYISAIENCDAEAFETPGFIAGYVRSYAKYLGMCPNSVYDKFCAESGYTLAHGMSEGASVRRTSLPAKGVDAHNEACGKNLFVNSATAFLPSEESILDKIEARAVASVAVLVMLILGLGYGGWSVLKEIQQVRVIPAEITPITMSEIDPLAVDDPNLETASLNSLTTRPLSDDTINRASVDRLYRPKALDVPVMAPREASIASLDPRNYGNFKPAEPSMTLQVNDMLAEALADTKESAGVSEDTVASVPKVLEPAPSQVALFATRDAWVSVTAADGTRLFEQTMKAGEEFILPASTLPLSLRAGMSGSIYFAINGELYGPAGEGTRVVKNVALSQSALQTAYSVADIRQDPQLLRVAASAIVSSFTIDDLSD